ncbi:hypothetical protein J3R83DRAFT_9738 [Lanmaoa asiatica]|nr:hypothetical protein J3R83DRAFT_9738 [Lanmaoa asiatica]
MTNPETTSRQALNGFWRTLRETGPLSSGVVAYPGLEASYLSSFGRPAGHASVQPPSGNGHEGADVSGDATQPSSSSSSSSAPRPALPTQGTMADIRQWYPNVYPGPPQYWHWYYDPTRHRQSSSHLHLQPTPPMSGPYIPSTTLVQSATDVIHEPLRALQSQFTAFQESLGNVKSDVKDALSQLHALRTAQTKTDKCIAELEGVIGVNSTGSGDRGRCDRGRGGRERAATHTESPLEGVDAETVPEKTLIQSLASIQSAIEELLPRKCRTPQSHLSVISREATSPLPLPPSANLTGQESFRTSSPPRSLIDPSQQYLTLHPAQFAPATLSESSSPLSSIAIPTPESKTSPPLAAPVKEYADASIQACPPSPTSGPSSSLSYSQRYAPGFTPVDWNIDPATLGPFASNSARPTAYTAEYLAPFLSDTHLPSATNTLTNSRIPGGDRVDPLRSSTASSTRLPTRTMSAPSLSSYPSEPLADNSRSQRARSTILPAASTSPDTSVVPSAGGTGPAMETPSSARSISQSLLLQTPSLTTEGVDSSMTSPGLGPPVDSQTPLTSPLGCLRRTDGTLISVFHVSRTEAHLGFPVQPHAESDPEDARMTSDTDGAEIIGGVKTTSGPIPTAAVHHRRSSPVVVDDEGLTSGLPTPPSETFTDDRESWMASRSTREHGAATNSIFISRTHLPRNFPVIPTPPFLTPEPSVGEGREMLRGTARESAQQGSLGVFSEPLSPFTPPMLSPIPAAGNLHGGSEVSDRVAAQKVTEEHTEDTRSTATLMNDGRLSPQIVQVVVEKSISSTNSGVPVITVTHEPRSIAMSNEDSSQVPQGSSAGRPNFELPERNLDANGKSPAYFQMDGYDLRFSSPLRCPSPPTSATPSRYVTPTDSRHAQEEDEVSSALMLGPSGVSTPVSGSASLSLIFSQHPSPRVSLVHPHLLQRLSTSISNHANDISVDPASSTSALELFTIDPSMLHGPTPTLFSHEPELPSLPQVSDRFLTPLTSLGDTDVDNAARAPCGRDNDAEVEADATGRSKKVRASEPADRSRGGSCRGRHSEPYRAAASIVCAASGATTVSGSAVGGPSASLNELALLARREPLKIRLRFPETMRSLKRKWDAVDGGGEEGGAGREGGCADSGEVGPGANVPVDDASQEGQGEAMSSGVCRPMRSVTWFSTDIRPGGLQISADVPPSRIGAVTAAPSTAMPIPGVSRLAPESSTGSGLADGAGEHPEMTSHFPVSRKRMKKQSERGAYAARAASEHARNRQEKRRRAPKAKPKSLVKYHVRNGQIVPAEPKLGPERALEPRLQAPVTPSLSDTTIHAAEADQNSTLTSTRICHRKGREDQMMKTPLSSPAKSGHPTPHTRSVKSPPTTEEVCDKMSRLDGAWPELSSVFSHWDTQFIQCDNCDMWFHYGCVAIESGDPRLELDALFICPTCHTQSARRLTLRNHDNTCARPDCPEPQVTGDAELYFVEKLVGRKKTEGYVYLWLAKWEGYPMTQASWIPRENVVGDGIKLFSAFLEDAVQEGADLSQDVVLLQEAVEAGWET